MALLLSVNGRTKLCRVDLADLNYHLYTAVSCLQSVLSLLIIMWFLKDKDDDSSGVEGNAFSHHKS